jgi:hypothetical protein
MTDYLPGSPDAIAAGCKCPRIDNGHGRGIYGDGNRFGWWINGDCPIHANGRDWRENAEASLCMDMIEP